MNCERSASRLYGGNPVRTVPVSPCSPQFNVLTLSPSFDDIHDARDVPGIRRFRNSHAGYPPWR